MSNFLKAGRIARLAGLALATATLVGACGSSQSSSSPAASSSGGMANMTSMTSTATPAAAATTVHSGHVTVSVSNYAFAPAAIVVKPGTKITFTNHDQTAHTATTIANGFDTGTIAPGKSVTVSVSRPGAYPYMCQFHAFMHGTVIVRG